MSKKRGCLTCWYARFTKTLSGKPKKNLPVRCLAPVPPIDDIMASLKPVVPASMLPHFDHKTIWAVGMWMDDDDGSECSAWKELTDVSSGDAGDEGS